MVPTELERVEQLVTQRRSQLRAQAFVDCLFMDRTNSPGKDRVVAWIRVEKVIVSISGAEAMMVVEAVVELERRVRDVARRRTGKEQCPTKTIAVIYSRARIKRENLLHSGIERQTRRVISLSVCRCQVHWVLSALRVGVGEDAGLESSGWHRRLTRQSCTKAVDFLIEEKKRSVLDNWATKGSAKLVTHVRIHLALARRVEPITRASKAIPAAKFVNAAMKGVGPALGHHINDCPGVATELGIEVVGNDAKLFRRIGVRAQDSIRNSGHGGVVVVYAIQQKIIVPVAGPVHREAAVTAISQKRSWGKKNQAVRVASNQRQVLDSPLVHEVAHLRTFQINV